MMEQQEGQRTEGRSVTSKVSAANADGLEMAALDAAREFFGPGTQLEVVRNYIASRLERAPSERRFTAYVTVREVSQP